MPGQPDGSASLSFDVTACHILDPLNTPNTIVDHNQSFQVIPDFAFGGSWANFIVSLGLTLNVYVRAESIGPGSEIQLGSTTVTTLAGKTQYGNAFPAPKPTINVPPNTLAPGVYKLVAAVTVSGTNPPPIAGFHEGPMIQVL